MEGLSPPPTGRRNRGLKQSWGKSGRCSKCGNDHETRSRVLGPILWRDKGLLVKASRQGRIWALCAGDQRHGRGMRHLGSRLSVFAPGFGRKEQCPWNTWANAQAVSFRQTVFLQGSLCQLYAPGPGMVCLVYGEASVLGAPCPPDFHDFLCIDQIRDSLREAPSPVGKLMTFERDISGPAADCPYAARSKFSPAEVEAFFT